MIENLPAYISIVFGLTTLATLFLFYGAVRNAKVANAKSIADTILIGQILWLVIQAILTLLRMYSTDTHSLPPKIFLFGILPTVILLVTLFVTTQGKAFIDSLPLTQLTYLHIVRIPVEIVLYGLFVNKAVPELMTFAGWNFDILAGITAPFIAYVGLTKYRHSKRLILLWNFLALALLANIVFTAILSTPSPLQKFAFDQPNIAILNFPVSWLPTFIVPVEMPSAE